MFLRRLTRLLLLLLFPTTFGACAVGSSGPGVENAELAEHRTLSTIVAELQLHLRDDTYRFDRARAADGQNVFAVALWRLDRLQRALDLQPDSSEPIALVIRFARARALERLRSYSEAALAYEEVARSASALSGPAEEAAGIMRLFASRSGASDYTESEAEELEFLDRRILEWGQLALRFDGTPYEPLAREETEAWAMLRVEWVAVHQGPEAALGACARLVEAHEASKNYPKHLIRLGDLYAETARHHVLRSRAKRDPFDAGRYEHLLDSALSAYELAEDERRPDTLREASSKIQALLAYHQGVRAYAR